MTPFAWTMLTVLITAAAANQGAEAAGRVLRWLGKFLRLGGGD